LLSDEFALAIAPFFDQIGPSHDEISTLVRRAGLADIDPNELTPGALGKMKRIRTLLTAIPTSRQRQGRALAESLIDALRSHGAFVPGNPNCPGEGRIVALRVALQREGFVLAEDGRVYPTNLDALEGVALKAALESYVRRSLTTGDDALLIGNAKDLVEAVARHVLELTTGAYPQGANFDATLYQAFDRLSLATPHPDVLKALDQDPEKAFEQVMWLLGVTAKRIRNEMGTGHGRPSTSPTLPRLGRITSQAGALVARLLLDRGAN
jgi:hypothetical protein